MSNITNNPFFFFSFFKFTDCSITSLVYCMRTENVVSVMCNGQWVMKNKKILTVDEVLLSLSLSPRKFSHLVCLRGRIWISNV